MRTGRWIASGVAVLVLTAAACGQTGSVRLVHKRQADEQWTRTSTRELVSISEALGSVLEGSVSEDASDQFTVEKADAAEWTISQTGTVNTRVENVPNSPGSKERQRLRATFKLSPQGKLLGVQAPPFEPVADNPLDLNSWLDYAFDQISPLAALPEQAVRPGDEWSVEQRAKLPNGTEVIGRRRYQLLSYDAGAGKAYLIEDATAPLEFAMREPGATVDVRGTLRSHTVLTFDVQAGKTLSGRGSLEITAFAHVTVNGMPIDARLHANGTQSFAEE